MLSEWIKIERCIADANGYFGEKFCRPMCWIDLLILARTEPKEYTIRGVKVSVGRGQILTSIRELCSRWSLSSHAVRNRIDELTSNGSITVAASKLATIITIVNYESYIVQDRSPQPAVVAEHAKPRTSPSTPKHRYAPTVLLTDDEYSMLSSAYGKDGAAWMIQKLDDYKAAKGATYKSDYRAILNWVVKEYQKANNQYGYTSNIRQNHRQQEKQQRDADIAQYVASKLSSGGVPSDV
ncbi:MAG: hypothetical protein MR037_02555 [Bacteroidales bacterium]|nr:hypothetical protein [Bacteroidales bacterium]